MKLITKTQELEETCKRLSTHSFITVDTEFLRESTFWPKLCLIQMASTEDEVLIDPLSQEMDLEAFFDLMANKSVIKVFHAARQDIEIVHHLSNIIPEPLFDTQVAAMVCGFGESVSYSQLVKKISREDLDKTSRFTDWSIRPLSDKQLRYAMADVTYLRDIYLYLRTELEKSKRANWLSEEIALLTDPETYIQRPENAWKRLKMRVKSQKSLAIMMEVAAWRETEAQKQNVPRSRVLKDEAIYDIAGQSPKNTHDLGRLRTINEGFARSSRGRDILQAVEKGLAKSPDTVPNIKKTKPLSTQASAVTDLLRVLLKATASKHDVATKLIATTDDLEKIATNDKADVPALRGWRYELFGADALALKHGKLSLSIQNGMITTFNNNPASQDNNLTSQFTKDEKKSVLI